MLSVKPEVSEPVSTERIYVRGFESGFTNVYKRRFPLKFDFKSGYHHLDIFKPHQRYLGFAWEVNSNPVFTVMPFSLATECYTFTKLMHPLVKYRRVWGLCTVLYLDDGIVAVKG